MKVTDATLKLAPKEEVKTVVKAQKYSRAGNYSQVIISNVTAGRDKSKKCYVGT